MSNVEQFPVKKAEPLPKLSPFFQSVADCGYLMHTAKTMEVIAENYAKESKPEIAIGFYDAAVALWKAHGLVVDHGMTPDKV